MLSGMSKNHSEWFSTIGKDGWWMPEIFKMTWNNLEASQSISKRILIRAPEALFDQVRQLGNRIARLLLRIRSCVEESGKREKERQKKNVYIIFLPSSLKNTPWLWSPRIILSKEGSSRHFCMRLDVYHFFSILRGSFKDWCLVGFGNCIRRKRSARGNGHEVAEP